MLAIIAAGSLIPFKSAIAFMQDRPGSSTVAMDRSSGHDTHQHPFKCRISHKNPYENFDELILHTLFRSLQASQACEYASSLECLNIYTSVFGGSSDADQGSQGSLQGTAMMAFVPTLIARCFYQLFKAGLYACLDWSFMARTGVCSLLFVFLPAMAYAVLLSPRVLEIFVAMYLPLLVMAIAFMCRIRRNIKRMLADRGGPWCKQL